MSSLLDTPVSRLSDIIDFIYDDGYYYLGIAANVAQFGHSTLDGVTATNGYQPAWLLVLAALAKLVGTDTRTFFIASCTLVYLIACATPLLALLWWKTPLRAAALCFGAGMAVIIVQQPVVFLEGLEPILFAPLAMALVMLIERRDIDPRWHLKLSLVLACAFLVRIDALALYAVVSVFLPLLETRSGALRVKDLAGRIIATAARLAIFVVPTVVAYLAINQWLFGSAVPVSGRAKALGGPFFSNWGIIYELAGHAKSIALLIAILGLLEFFARRFARSPGWLFFPSLVIVTATIAIQYIYYAAFSTWMLWPWYQYLIGIAMALIVGRIIYLASLFDLRRRESLAGIAGVLIVGAWAANRGADLAVNSLSPETQARLATLHLPGVHPAVAGNSLTQEQANLIMLNGFFDPKRKTVIAMGDRSGGLAYWGRAIVSVEQTEGLTMGMDYLRARAANDAERYLEHFPIDYMVIDREVIPTRVDSEGRTILVVPDPIQGRVSKTQVPTFCFPAEAIRYETAYPSWRGISTRIAFQFSERLPCSPETLAGLRSIETGIGLRQFSLPSEYDEPSIKRSEDHDRHYSGGSAQTAGFGRYVVGKQTAQ